MQSLLIANTAMFKDSKIYIAGHTGLLGSALIKKLTKYGCNKIVTRSHAELDLTDKGAVLDFFSTEKPEYVFLAAGKVGGIISNKTYPADYLHINLAIQDNVFEAACRRTSGVKHMLFYGSSCIYPKFSTQPIKEEHLLTAPLEETSEGYAVAKIAGIIACRAYNQQYRTNRFIALVPNTMYGPNDNFNLEDCHVLSALIRRFHEAKISKTESVTLWGSGTPRREFVFSEDVAEASIFVMQSAEQLENRHYNVGSGIDYSIQELTESIAEIVGYKGDIIWDKSKPDGTPKKLLDSSRLLSLGWKPAISFKEGLKRIYQWYLMRQQKSEVKKQNSVLCPSVFAKATPDKLSSVFCPSEIQAVILAGGLGRRLRSAVSDKPKVLAEVLDRPFLEYLLDQLSSAGIREVVLCTGYMACQVIERFGQTYKNMHLIYSMEEQQLGTGGALRFALPHLWSDTILVMNGDSYTDMDLSAYMNWFFQRNGDVALSLTKVSNTARYGSVTVDTNGQITAFNEKGTRESSGWINAGIYLMKKSIIASIPADRPYSLESEFFPSLIGNKLLGFRSVGRFIDIGTPTSYMEAEEFFTVKST